MKDYKTGLLKVGHAEMRQNPNTIAESSEPNNINSALYCIE